MNDLLEAIVRDARANGTWGIAIFDRTGHGDYEVACVSQKARLTGPSSEVWHSAEEAVRHLGEILGRVAARA